MLEILLNLILNNASEIGTFAVTTLVALIKRKTDKKKIRKILISKGISEEQLNGTI